MKYVGANAVATSARDGAIPQQKNEKARMSLPFFDRHLPLCIHEGSYFGGKIYGLVVVIKKINFSKTCSAC